MTEKIINVAKDFSRFPSGRFKSDSRFSGERFRDDFLKPALLNFDSVVIYLDGTLGYGSSFLDEVFGALRRQGHISKNDLQRKLRLETSNVFLKSEIEGYLR